MPQGVTAPTEQAPGPSQQAPTQAPVEPVAPVTQTDPQTPEAPTGTTAPLDEQAAWEWLQQQDPREIAKRHRQFANVLGTAADQLERRRAQQREAEWTRQQEIQKTQTELRTLRKTDPVAFAEKTEELENEFLSAQAQARREQAAEARAWKSIDVQLNQFSASLPIEVQKALEGKTFDEGDAAASRRAYITEANRLTAEHFKKSSSSDEIEKEVKKRLAAEKKAMEEGLKKDLNSKQAANEPNPVLGSGDPISDGPMTQAEYDRIKHDRSARRASRDRFIAGVSQGLITNP